MKTAQSKTRLIGLKAAAAELGLAYTTLRDRVIAGELPFIRVDRAIFLERSDLEHWIERHKETAA